MKINPTSLVSNTICGPAVQALLAGVYSNNLSGIILLASQWFRKDWKQAGAELGQAHYKIG